MRSIVFSLLVLAAGCCGVLERAYTEGFVPSQGEGGPVRVIKITKTVAVPVIVPRPYAVPVPVVKPVAVIALPANGLQKGRFYATAVASPYRYANQQQSPTAGQYSQMGQSSGSHYSQG